MSQQDFRTQIDTFQDRDVQIGAAVGLIVGLLLGWFVLGWWLAPVQWVDARPSDLHPEWQTHYVAMVVDSYLLTGDAQAARQRLDTFDDETLESVFGEVEARFEQRGATRQARAAQQLADQLGISPTAPEAATAAVAEGTPTPPPEATSPPDGGILGSLTASETTRTVLQVCGLALLVIVLILGGVWAFVWYQRRSLEFEGVEQMAAESRRPRAEPEPGSMSLGERVAIQYQGEEPGYEQAVRIYHGDDIVATCSLEGMTTLSSDGNVVACRVRFTEQQTEGFSPVTCVFASRQVYGNEAERTALQDPKVPTHRPAEVVLAEAGQTVHLEQETLGMTLRVMDVENADLNERYISRLVLELEPHRKGRGPEEEPEAGGPGGFRIDG